MEKVYVDFSDKGCVAQCDHCVFGVGKEKTSISLDQLESYRRVEEYVKARKAYLSFGLSDGVDEYAGSLSFVTCADDVRVSTRNLDIYLGSKTASTLSRVLALF